MQNPFKMLGDLNKMRQQAATIQKQLEGEEYTVEKGRIKVVITGNQHVKLVTIDGQEVPEMRDIVNDAIKQSQQAAAAKLSSMSKELGIGE